MNATCPICREELEQPGRVKFQVGRGPLMHFDCVDHGKRLERAKRRAKPDRIEYWAAQNRELREENRKLRRERREIIEAMVEESRSIVYDEVRRLPLEKRLRLLFDPFQGGS